MQQVENQKNSAVQLVGEAEDHALVEQEVLERTMRSVSERHPSQRLSAGEDDERIVAIEKKPDL